MEESKKKEKFKNLIERWGMPNNIKDNRDVDYLKYLIAKLNLALMIITIFILIFLLVIIYLLIKIKKQLQIQLQIMKN